MDFLTFLILYIGGFSAFLFIMLFGEQSLFVGTPVATAHYLLSAGPCDAGYWVVSRMFGAKGEKCADTCGTQLCESSTPYLQVCYLAMVGAAYSLYHQNVFSLLEAVNLPLWHMYTGTACLLLCLAAFTAASISDPGFVSKGNVQAYLQQTPYDNITCRPKLCRTCKLQRPARAKHCNICGRCVARFDHHCGWVNNCIGALNLRWFLAFLLANCIMCFYGSTLIVFILKGELDRRRVWKYRIVNADGTSRPLTSSYSMLVEWIAGNYNIQVLLGFVLAAAGLMMGGFFVYHVWLIHLGSTTYETYKWRDLRQRQAIDDAARPDMDRSAAFRQRSWLWPFAQRRFASVAAPSEMPRNIYKQSVAANIRDVLFPRAALSVCAASTEASAKGKMRMQASGIANGKHRKQLS